jgi:UDP-3-O-[3-hydroxymyristoyl] glucosamine N-acyltransferase
LSNVPPVRRLGELAALVGGEVIGDASLVITGVNGLTEAGPGELSFYGNTRYRQKLQETKAAAVLVNGSALPKLALAWVRVANPHLAFAKITAVFHPQPKPQAGISDRAFVHPEASVDPTATVMPFVTIGRGATVGPRTVLYPGVYVGEDANIGEDCRVYSNATIREGCLIGSRVVLHASCVIGADGFGFAFDPSVPEHFKVPQVGIVRIEDDVEVGAGSCIDRATTGETLIGHGTKIDNLVQVAHNVRIGPLSIVCAQAGISGSAEIGTGVVLAGQVGVVGHIRVGDLAKVGAQSGVAQSVPDGEIVSGAPAMPHREWLKNSAAFARLSDLVKEVRSLRSRVEELEEKKQ